MSSPPNSPNQHRGRRQLLGPFDRSPSRSRSQSPMRYHLRPTLTEASLTDNAETTGLADDSIIHHANANLMTLVAPDATSAGTETHSPMNTTSHSTGAPTDVGSKLFSPRNVLPNQEQIGKNEAWNELRGSLRLLGDASSAFSSLSSTIDSLLGCLDVLEVVLQNRQDFEGFATTLTPLVQSLNQYKEGFTSIFVSSSVKRVAMSIQQHTLEIKKSLERILARDTRAVNADEEGLIEHYRRIQFHFRQLQINASMSTQSVENEQLANMRLEVLKPAKQAAYNSGLSADINRRGCTEGTRIGVLNGLDDWVNDTTSSPIYWMSGMAGTGKTTIASTFCKRVERRKLLAASFFCTRSSAEYRDVSRIVPTIAHQLARYSIPFQSSLCKILEQNPDVGSRNMLKQFELLLKEPLQQVKDVIPDNLVIVIDALDECDDRNGIELVLDMLFRTATHVPLKFLVTSRPEREISGKMSTYAQSREVLRLHDIEQSLVQADIELYLREELKTMPLDSTDIERLAQRSGTLFIYAATLVRYISNKRSVDPYRRLRAVVDMAPESTKQHARLDTLYKAVLKPVLGEGELVVEKTNDIRATLWTVLLAQEPISVATIAQLTDIDDSQRVIDALDSLRSVLHQSADTGLVSTLHASFPDFMFSRERSGFYYCDIPKHSQLLAQECFSVMKQQLRFNICDLTSSFMPDVQVEGIQERIEKSISPTLAYACRYWAGHIASAPKSRPLLQTLDEFLSRRLLFWMEVLSLRRELSMGVEGLLKAQQWLMLQESSSTDLLLFIDDARSFVAGFAVNPSSISTPHIYISSLAFCPRSNLVYKRYYERTRGILELKGSLMERREAAPLAIWNVPSEIISMALSPDGTRVAIGCLDETVSILSAYDGTVYVGPLPGHSRTVNSVAFSPDGGRVVSSSLGSIRVWNAYNGTPVGSPFKGHMRFINSVSFSPDGAHIVSGGHDCTVRVWSSYDGTPRFDPLTDHTDTVHCVTFSPDGALIASASSDQTIRLWNSCDGTPAAASPFVGHTSLVDSLAFTRDGAQLVSAAGDKTIRVWKTSDGSLITNSFEASTGGINALAISPDGTRIAAGSNDHAIRVWRIGDGKLVAGPFFGHTDAVKSVAYSPDGTRVFSSSVDKTIRVWNVRDGMFPPPPLPPQNALTGIKSVVFCPDSKHFLSSGVQAVLRMWDTTDGSCMTIPGEANFFPTPLSILSNDGSYIASTSRHGMIQIMSSLNGSLVAGPFEVERTSLSSFGFSHNSEAILLGCHDGTIKVCSLRSGNTAVGSFRGHQKGVSSLTESPDCSLLVSYSGFEFALRVWNIITPALDLKLFNDTSTDPTSAAYSYAAVYDGWNITEDGWMVNNSQHLLFWLPPEVAAAWCSPYATLAVTRSGVLQVPKQNPLIGSQWVKCYIPE